MHIIDTLFHWVESSINAVVVDLVLSIPIFNSLRSKRLYFAVPYYHNCEIFFLTYVVSSYVYLKDSVIIGGNTDAKDSTYLDKTVKLLST